MIDVIFSKIENGSAIRTEEVIGQCNNYPIIGEPFDMIAPPLTNGFAYRCIQTSDVRQIIEESNNVKIIHTRNSIYKLQF